MTLLDEFFIKWTTPPFSYILIAIIVAIITYIIVKEVYKPMKEHFKGEGIDYVIKELNIKESFKNFSRKTKKGKLYHNLGVVNIDKVMLANVKVKLEQDKEPINHRFILFKTGSLIANLPLLNKVAKGVEYFIIDNNNSFIEKNKYGDVWVVKPNIFMHKFADVWICSAEGTSFLTDLIYKRTYENAREEEMNYIKRVVWYNDKYASNMTSQFVEHELEDDKYRKRVERETGVKR